MKKLKELSLVILAFTLISIANPIGASALWKENNTGWWYMFGNIILMYIVAILMVVNGQLELMKTINLKLLILSGIM